MQGLFMHACGDSGWPYNLEKIIHLKMKLLIKGSHPF